MLPGIRLQINRKNIKYFAYFHVRAREAENLKFENWERQIFCIFTLKNYLNYLPTNQWSSCFVVRAATTSQLIN